MKLSDVKKVLPTIDEVNFLLPNGVSVSKHFHVTEVGITQKKFIDCGGTVREESVANFQLWEADDFDHRLAPKKLLNIVELSQDKLNIPDLEIEVEYQGLTIEKYSLDFDGKSFLLGTKKTDCLAKDKCGIDINNDNVRLKVSSCEPGSGCC